MPETVLKHFGFVSADFTTFSFVSRMLVAEIKQFRLLFQFYLSCGDSFSVVYCFVSCVDRFGFVSAVVFQFYLSCGDSLIVLCHV